ncbi:copper resistance protein NlpE [Mucilaginibacter corticis]|uniref:Copper resistance protein NlpE n=1 Tax=Mucilaginibacter corticis TaxID=2597670 RepID=A0A556MWP2_9SPHI|nr:lipocalin family protein [Mucilaginibacter corticis]TSJ44346.1 copper resistance protein NlpE [Mucilaginibacter corticis]
MKKILINLTAIVVLVFAIASTGCKKDNSGSASVKIVGKWLVKKSITHQTYQGITRHDTTFNSNDSYQFNVNGTAFIKESDTEENTVWKVSNNKLVLGVTNENGIAQVLDINTLTNTSLELHRSESSPDLTVDQTITLSKEDS